MICYSVRHVRVQNCHFSSFDIDSILLYLSGEKYVPHTLKDKRCNEFTSVEKRSLSIAPYEDHFTLCPCIHYRCYSQRRRGSVHLLKVWMSDFIFGALQMVFSSKTFQEMVEHVKNVKGVKQDFYANPQRVVASVCPFLRDQFVRGILFMTQPTGSYGHLLYHLDRRTLIPNWDMKCRSEQNIR